jgi:hypothetical protein
LNELNENLMKELSKVLQFISTFIDWFELNLS